MDHAGLGAPDRGRGGGRPCDGRRTSRSCARRRTAGSGSPRRSASDRVPRTTSSAGRWFGAVRSRRAPTNDSRSAPSTSSMTRKRRPPSRVASRMRATCGLRKLRRPRTRASFSSAKSRSRLSSPCRKVSRNFNATRTSSRSSIALQTEPCPPAPSGLSRRYRSPTRTPGPSLVGDPPVARCGGLSSSSSSGESTIAGERSGTAARSGAWQDDDAEGSRHLRSTATGPLVWATQTASFHCAEGLVCALVGITSTSVGLVEASDAREAPDLSGRGDDRAPVRALRRRAAIGRSVSWDSPS